MTKKNIIAVAEVIMNLESYKDIDGCKIVHFEEIVDKFCVFMSRENPRFNEKLFRDFIAGKCGPNGGLIK